MNEGDKVSEGLELITLIDLENVDPHNIVLESTSASRDSLNENVGVDVECVDFKEQSFQEVLNTAVNIIESENPDHHHHDCIDDIPSADNWACEYETTIGIWLLCAILLFTTSSNFQPQKCYL